MPRSLLIPLTALALAGCAQDMEPAKEALERRLSNAVNDVEYRDLRSYPGGVVCGEYDPIVRFGQHEGYRPFLVVRGEADRSPSEQDLAIYCSENPAGEIRQRLGLGPLDESNPSLMTVYRDLARLDRALDEYLADNLDYPLTGQGLEALITASDQPPVPPRFREGGYIDAIPDDPWGRSYQYSAEEKLQMEPREYELQTLGRDGAPGGEGEDTDIGNRHLPYLRHLEALEK